MAKFSDDLLKYLFKGGSTQAEAARVLGVTPAAVSLRVRIWRTTLTPEEYLQIPSARKGKSGSRKTRQYSDEQLRKMLEGGATQAQASRAFGVTPASVCVRLRRLAQPSKAPRDRTDAAALERAIKAYKKRDLSRSPQRGKFTDEQLFLLLEEGISLSQCAHRLNVSPPAIGARVRLWEGVVRNRKGPPIKPAPGESDESYGFRLKDVRKRAKMSVKKCMLSPDRRKAALMREKKRSAENEETRLRRSEQRMDSYRRNPRQQNIYRQIRKAEDQAYRLTTNLRSRAHAAFKRSKDGEMSFRGKVSLIGCSPAQLISYIQAQFQPKMTLENYATRWVMDHILPICAFDLACPLQRLLCFNFTNLRPLCKKANLSKLVSDKRYAEQVRATRGGLWTCQGNFPNPSFTVARRASPT